jgi:hypothetical protein
MTKIIGHSNAVGSRSKRPLEPFQMMLIHDGEIALAEARQIIARLLTRSLTGFDVHRDELSFSEIAHPEIFAEAAELAAGCDLLIIATVNRVNLPNEVIAWLHRWFESRQEKDAALVCLVGSVDGALLESPVHMYLQHLTDQYNLAFFPSVFITPGENLQRSIKRCEETTLARQVLRGYCPRPESWGINE